MNMTIYGILEKISNVADNLSIDENGVVDTTELDELNVQLNEKVENIALYIKNLDAFVEQMGNEISNMKARQESASNKAKALRNYLANGMQLSGMNKYESTKCAVSFRKSKSVAITDETIIPDEYFTEKITKSVNKTAIKDAIAGGAVVPGAYIEEKQNIQIK